MNIFILFGAFSILLFLFYLVLNRDIMAPTVILGISYILAILAAIYNVNNWMIHLGTKTCFILIFSYALFGCIEVVIKFLWRSRKREEINVGTGLKEIVVPNYMIYLYIFGAIIIVLLFGREVYRIAVEHGYVGEGNFLTYYRMAASYGVLSLKDDINQIVNQLFKIITVGAYISTYIFINNFIVLNISSKQKWKKLFLCRIPIYIFLVGSILTANRLQYIRFAIAGFVMFYLLWNYHHNWSVNISGKIICWGIIAFILLLICFVWLRGIVGRVNQQAPIDYVTRYAGASIELFDQYIKKPVSPSSYWGGETFYGIYTGLRKLNLSDYNFIGHLEFRELGDCGYSSNTYTALRRYYHDFGMVGIVVFQSLLSFFYNIFYYFHIRMCSKRTQFKEILYAFLFCAIPLHSINEIFFSSYLSVAYTVYIIEFYLMWRIITKVRFAWKK